MSSITIQIGQPEDFGAAAVVSLDHSTNARYITVPAAGPRSPRVIIPFGMPAWIDGRHMELSDLGCSCGKCFDYADIEEARSIAFPCLIAEGWPPEKAWTKIIQTCRNWLLEHPELNIQVTLAVPDQETQAMGQRILDRLWHPAGRR